MPPAVAPPVSLNDTVPPAKGTLAPSNSTSEKETWGNEGSDKSSYHWIDDEEDEEANKEEEEKANKEREGATNKEGEGVKEKDQSFEENKSEIEGLTESGERKEGEIEEQQGEHVGDLKGEEKESEGEDNYEGEGNEEEKESKVMALLEEVHEDEGSEELMSSLTPFVEDEEVESDEDDLPLYEVGKKNMKAHAKPTRTTSHARKEVAPPTRTPLTRN
ncbi:uncharacterized protein [Nicotiana sylvestris]|uniref:uncharacterized protein n=1 Tax=Nicotiana sylvestris TaxID=4096 RepID=UPI00388C5B51